MGRCFVSCLFFFFPFFRQTSLLNRQATWHYFCLSFYMCDSKNVYRQSYWAHFSFDWKQITMSITAREIFLFSLSISRHLKDVYQHLITQNKKLWRQIILHRSMWICFSYNVVSVHTNCCIESSNYDFVLVRIGKIAPYVNNEFLSLI